MSTTIDERVVSMKFDNTDFKNRAEETLKILQKLKTETDNSFKDLGSSSSKWNSVFKGFDFSKNGFDLSKLTSKMSASVGGIAGIFSKLNSKVSFSGIIDSITGITKAADKVDLSNITESTEKAASGFSFLQHAASVAFGNIMSEAAMTAHRVMKSFTTDLPKEGFAEYELEQGSIQTIMAGTGASIDEVMASLDELNHYADRTIYSFSDMTQSIGKFTNAGVPLNDSVKAIQGVANVAALSGANANEASRAMYNFAQALSSGNVKLVDWMSIENANMATKGFKEQLLETAVALGTVKKNADGTYKVLTKNNQGSQMKENIDAVKGFRDSLQYQWMTSDVLTETLKKYTDETTDLGKAAYAAAEDVKTFTQLMDTLKEAVGSGWAYTWRMVFGDFEEAKKMWSDVYKLLSGVIDAQANARNSMLKEWHDLGGHDLLADSLMNTLNGLIEAGHLIKEAFHEIFPPMTGKRLFEITQSLHRLTENFHFADIEAKNFKMVFKGVFAAVDILRIGITKLLSASSPVGKLIGLIGGALYKAVMKICTKLVEFDEYLRGIENSAKSVKEMLKEVREEADILISTFDTTNTLDMNFLDKAAFKLKTDADGYFSGVASILEKVSELKDLVSSKITSSTFSELKDTFVESFKRISTEAMNDLMKWLEKLNWIDVARILAGGFIVSILKRTDEIVATFNELLGDTKQASEDLKSITENITGLLGDIRKALVLYQKEIKAKIILTIATAVAILAGSIALLAVVANKFGGGTVILGLVAIAGALVSFVGAIWLIVKMFGKEIGGAQIVKATAAIWQLVPFSIALMTLAASVRLLARLKFWPLVKGLGGVLILSIALVKIVEYMSYEGYNPVGMMKRLRGLIMFAIALRIMAGAVVMLGKDINGDQALQGAEVVGFLSMVLILITSLFSDMGKFGTIKIAPLLGLVAVAGAIYIAAQAMMKLGQLNDEQMQNAVLSITGIAGAFSLLLWTIESTKQVKLFTALLAFTGAAKAMKTLADAMYVLGNGMDFDAISLALLSVYALVGVMAAMVGIAKGGAQGVFAVFMLNLMVEALVDLILNITKLDSVEDPLKLLSTVSVMLGTMIILAKLAEFVGEIGKNMYKGVGFFLIMGVAVAIFSEVIGKLAEVPFEKALGGATIMSITMVALLGIATMASQFVLKAIGGAVALVILSGVVYILAEGFKKLADIPQENVANGLIALAGSLIVLTVAMIAMGAAFAFIMPGVAALLAISGALIVFSFSVTTFATSMKLLLGLYKAAWEFFTGIIETIKGAISGFAGFIVEVFKLFEVASPSKVFIYLGEMIIEGLIQGIAGGIGNLISKGLEMGGSFIEAIKSILSPGGFSNLGQSLMGSFGAGASSGSGQIGGVMSGFGAQLRAAIDQQLNPEQFKPAGAGVYQAVNDGMNETSNLPIDNLNAFGMDFNSAFDENFNYEEYLQNGQMMPEATAAGINNSSYLPNEAMNAMYANMLANGQIDMSLFEQNGAMIVQGTTNGINNNADAPGEAMGSIADIILQAICGPLVIQSPSKKMEEVGQNIVQGLANGIGNFIDNAIDKIAEVANGIITKATSLMSPSTLLSTGMNLVQGLISGISSKGRTALGVVGTLASNIVTKVTSKLTSDTFYQTGKNAIQGLINGMSSLADKLANTTSRLVNNAIDRVRGRSGFDEGSPSKVMIRIGRHVMEGWEIGMIRHAHKPLNAIGEITDSALDNISWAMSKAYDILNSEVDPDLTIRPVMDLSDVYSGVSDINSMLSTDRSIALAGRTSVGMNAMAQLNQNGIRTNNTDVVGAINTLRSDVAELQTTIRGLRMVLDTGALVGGIADPMDEALGFRAVMAGRGV